MKLEAFIDVYDIKARVAPSLIVIFPILFSVWVWFPITQTWADALSGTVFAIFFSWLLGRIAREQGLKAQDRLFKKWGGNVAANMLRLDNTHLNSLDKRRYRKFLEQQIDGLALPTEEEERAEKPDVTERYEMAINWLRRSTRDQTKFFLVFKENVNFGFHRNLYGMKGFAIFFYLAMLALNIFTLIKGSDIGIENYTVNSISSIAVSCLSIIVWIFFITEKSVKSAAIAYSERLLEACEEL